MPCPSASENPFFEGSNVNNFLNQYSQMCTDYRVETQEKIKRLLWYYEMFTGKYVETLISSSKISWATLWKVLWEEYKDQDLNQQMNSRQFLETYKNKSRADTLDIFVVLQMVFDYFIKPDGKKKAWLIYAILFVLIRLAIYNTD